MAVEYFGEVNSDGSPIASPTGEDNTGGAQIQATVVAAIQACPGTGQMNLVSLAMYGRVGSGSGNIRIGIYRSSDGALVCQTDTFAASSSSAWQERLAANVTWSIGTALGGGTEYKLSWACATDVYVSYKAGATGDLHYAAGDYSAGLPSNISTLDGTWHGHHYIRCGVEASSGATAINIACTDSFALSDIVLPMRSLRVASLEDNLEN